MKKLPKNKKNLHVKVGDKVKVISGQNKGKIGIIRTVIKETSKVIIEGINIKIKHIKPNRPGETGQIKELEFPIHSSNVAKYEE
jgi:large subunit ribosomal protein L24